MRKESKENSKTRNFSNNQLILVYLW